MNKTTYLLTSLLGLTILTGAACTTVQNTNLPVNTASMVTTTTTPVQADADEAQAPSVDQYYIAEKSGNTTTVYKDTYETDAREVVFSFQEAVTYTPGNGNAYREKSPAVAYDRNTDTFAYTSVDGLALYRNQTGETIRLISKTGTFVQKIDGIDIDLPIWSDAVVADRFFFYNPQFSADGQYLSFSGPFHELNSTYVMDLNTKTIVELAGKDGQGISGYDVVWSPTGHNLVTGEGVNYGSRGLFFVHNEDFGNAEVLLDDNLEAAVFLDEDTIAYTYGPNSNDPQRLAIINIDGSAQQDLVDDGVNNYAVAADKQYIIYSKSDAYTAGNNGLWIYSINSGSSQQLVTEAVDEAVVLQNFNSDALVYITYNTTNHSSILYSMNSTTLEKYQRVTEPTPNTIANFLGSEYMLF